MSHKKSLIFALTLFLLTVPFSYCTVKLCQTLPDNILLAKGADCKIKTPGLVKGSVGKGSDALAANVGQKSFITEENGNLSLFTDDVGRYDVELKFLGVVPIKTMSVDVIDEDTVYPSGDTIGIKIHTQGVLVVKISSVKNEENKEVSPAKHAGICEGDIITKIDGTKVLNSDHFSQLIDEKKGQNVTLELIRNSQVTVVNISPVKCGEHYKIGAWIRDSTAGIGTLTFVKPDTEVFGSLGHGISDIDTGCILTVEQGSVTNCDVSSVLHGEKGKPGELRGVFVANDVGVIKRNSKAGVYGRCETDKISHGEPMKIATRFEVNTGKAQILATVDKEGPKEYEIEIEKVMTASGDEKGMIVKITDERLLEKTGGIVQGMSGSPIIQNGKLVGAITHVFVNDPTRGYGIFIELMMDEAQKVEAAD